MTRHRNARLRNVIRRLRPSPTSIAAAAAAYDPAWLLAVQTRERRATGYSPARAHRRRPAAGSSSHRPLTQESTGSLLLAAAVAVALAWSSSPWP